MHRLVRSAHFVRVLIGRALLRWGGQRTITPRLVRQSSLLMRLRQPRAAYTKMTGESCTN